MKVAGERMKQGKAEIEKLQAQLHGERDEREKQHSAMKKLLQEKTMLESQNTALKAHVGGDIDSSIEPVDSSIEPGSEELVERVRISEEKASKLAELSRKLKAALERETEKRGEADKSRSEKEELLRVAMLRVAECESGLKRAGSVVGNGRVSGPGCDQVDLTGCDQVDLIKEMKVGMMKLKAEKDKAIEALKGERQHLEEKASEMERVMTAMSEGRANMKRRGRSRPFHTRESNPCILTLEA